MKNDDYSKLITLVYISIGFMIRIKSSLRCWLRFLFVIFLTQNFCFSLAHSLWLSETMITLPSCRVWKGILGIRDLPKIRCGIRENAKYLDGIRDLTATREAGFAKIWARDAGLFGLSVGNSGNRHDPSKRSSGKSESTRRAQNINQKGQSTS